MKNRVQELAKKNNITHNKFIGAMRMRGCSEPMASKIWRGEYESLIDLKNNDINLTKQFMQSNCCVENGDGYVAAKLKFDS